MSSLKRVAFGMAVGGTIVLMAAKPASAQNWNTCPSLGSNTAGCAVLITVGPGGTLTVQLNPTNSQPYDGSDDALVGVVNNSGGSLSSLHLSASGSGIFGFENDGICDGTYTLTCDTASGFNFPTGYAVTGYEGPNTFFSNFSSTDNYDSGDVNFMTALVNGGSTYFALENTPDAILTSPGGLGGSGSVGPTGPGGSTVPEPSSLALLGTGLVALVPAGRRRWRR